MNTNQKLKRKPSYADPLKFLDADPNNFQLEQLLTYQTSILSNMMNRQMSRILSKNFGITVPEWRVLATLGNFKDMSIRDITAHTYIDKALVSRTVTKLVKRKFVSSQPDPMDGRLVILSLTASGKKLYQAIVPFSKKRQRDLLSPLTAQERIAFNQVLGKLIQHLAHTSD